MAAAAQKLAAAIENSPDERLATEAHPGLVYARMITGVAQHNMYHLGQIATLRKLI